MLFQYTIIFYGSLFFLFKQSINWLYFSSSGQKVCVCVSCSVMSDSLQPHGLEPVSLLCPWNSPGKNTGVAYHFLLQGIFMTDGSKPVLLHFRQILFLLSHQGSPEIQFDHLFILVCIIIVMKNIDSNKLMFFYLQKQFVC